MPTIRQEELPAVEPEVLAELVEQHVAEVPVTSGPDLPATAVAAGTAAASAGEAGTTAAGTAGAARGEDKCCCWKQRERSSSSCPASPGAFTSC